MSLPEKDRTFETKKNMINAIRHLLGGRVAELLTLDDISTGASNDIMRATEIARDMVTRYGFSEKLGPVCYADSQEVFLGNDFSSKKSYSEDVAAEIDHEIRNIVDTAFEDTRTIIEDNMDKLERVAQALLAVETLDGEQFEALYRGDITPAELEEQVRQETEKLEEQNAEEAAETERIRKEEEAKLAEELAKYDTDYMNSNEMAVPSGNVTDSAEKFVSELEPEDDEDTEENTENEEAEESEDKDEE